MEKELYKQDFNLTDNRLCIDFYTDEGEYRPAHWHSSVEFIYILNGEAEVVLNGKTYQLKAGDCMAIDSNRIHATHCRRLSMAVYLHFSQAFIESVVDKAVHFRCSRQTLSADKLKQYRALGKCCEELVECHLKQPAAAPVKEESIALDILYHLIRDFSEEDSPERKLVSSKEQRRIQEIVSYMDAHYREPISLQEMASHFGLSREYFCRFFKKQTGIPPAQHLSRVRLSHVYYELGATNIPVMELLEKNGIRNYKTFSRMFKEVYGCTPREIRKTAPSLGDS